MTAVIKQKYNAHMGKIRLTKLEGACGLSFSDKSDLKFCKVNQL